MKMINRMDEKVIIIQIVEKKVKLKDQKDIKKSKKILEIHNMFR